MNLALLGFDGLDPEVIYDNPDRLPNIHQFMQHSMHGEWNTPGHTIPSFTAALTGRKYNVTDFRWDKEDGGYQRHRQTGYEYIWDVCDSSMTIINNPVLYPPEDIDNAMVCGFLTPDGVTDSNLARPMEVQDKINEMDYIVDVEAHSLYEELGADGMIDYLCEMMDKRAELASWLIDKYNSDLFFCTWTAPDRWFHVAFMEDEDYMPLYEKVDEMFKKIVSLPRGDIPVIAFSDHGFRHHEHHNGVHKGHRYKGWYSINSDLTPSYRDDSVNILDLFPTVVNYLGGGIPSGTMGRVLFHPEEQNESVESKLRDLGYLE